jgi:hypothetical protein
MLIIATAIVIAVVVLSGSILTLHVVLLLLGLITERRLVVALHVVLHLAWSLLVICVACHRDVLHHGSQVLHLLLQALNTGQYIYSEILVALCEL